VAAYLFLDSFGEIRLLFLFDLADGLAGAAQDDALELAFFREPHEIGVIDRAGGGSEGEPEDNHQKDQNHQPQPAARHRFLSSSAALLGIKWLSRRRHGSPSQDPVPFSRFH
jgi:hypothetical protein